MKYYGAIEAGGTKFVCSVIADPDNYFEEERFPTTTPEETIARTIDFFKLRQKNTSWNRSGSAVSGRSI